MVQDKRTKGGVSTLSTEHHYVIWHLELIRQVFNTTISLLHQRIPL